MNVLRRIHPAILYAVAAYTFWVVDDVLVKLIGNGLSMGQVLVYNRAMNVLVYLCFAHQQAGWRELKTKRPFFHLTRTLFSVVNALAIIYAVRHLPLTNFYTLAFTTPLIIALISCILPHERPTPGIWLAMITGFAGVMVAIGPNNYDPLSWPFLPVTAMFIANLCFSCYALTIKWGGSNETTTALAFYPDVLVLIFGTVYVSVTEPWIFDIRLIAMALSSGLFTGIAFLFITAAYRRGKNAIVAPFHYTQIITGGIAGYVFWGDVPTWKTILGAGIIIASGIYIILSNHRQCHEDKDQVSLPAV